MALFEFELARVQDIIPWDSPDGPSLSWFALTHGRFWMPVGDQVLFEYSDQIMAHWGHQGHSERCADYQIAAFVREMLGSVAAGVAPLSERIERLVLDWDSLNKLRSETYRLNDSDETSELACTAMRWLDDRSPFASYLVAEPSFHFVRVGQHVRIHWDNRDRVIDGCPVWTAQVGVYAMPVESFVAECRDFAGRLLIEMQTRIDALEAGAIVAQTAVDVGSLREQHETWRGEFDRYFKQHQPEIDWHETEDALELLAEKSGLQF